jgi:protein phosphatase
VRSFALFGETTGETDEFGLPVRANWASDYRGAASVVYGHTPVPDAVWLNNTINIDTGCVFGGKLTALRWPERELASVAARQTYAQPARPLVKATSEGDDTLLRIEDALGKQVITTRLMSNVIIEADRAAAALEVMSRFALDPRWLIYLPPTMSPSETSSQPDYLEYPTEALAYYRSAGVERVVCEEKHMGSRGVLVVCRDPDVARKRFGVTEGEALGAYYTRTGRRFFDDDALDRALLERVSAALGVAGFWERFETDWICLDAELLPWSAKAQGLLREQYAPVATAAQAALDSAIAATEAAQARGIEVGAELATCGHSARTPNAMLPPIAPTAGRPRDWRACASRRFTCSPAKVRPTSTARTPGTWRSWRGSRRETRSSWRRRIVRSRSTIPTPAPPRPTGGWS